MRAGALLALATAGAVLAGCASGEKVVRVVDGRPVAGEFVPSDAYASYLRAAIADAAGDLDGAVEGFAVSAALGPQDPEPLARLGDARCRRDPRDPRSEEAFARALALDGAYGPALEARARCAAARGDKEVAILEAREAVRADPTAAAPLLTLARLDAEGGGAEAAALRDRLVAMTLVAGTDAAAWEALATWARGHGDVRLEARALAHRMTLASAPPGEIAGVIARLQGEGESATARRLARARVEQAGVGPVDERSARLAIDDALLAGDVQAARRLATRARVRPVVVAARALLLGDPRTATEIATTLAEADPAALAPRLVLAAAAGGGGSGGRAVARALSGAWRRDEPIAAEAWLAYGRAIVRAGAAEGARIFLSAIPRDAIPTDDPLTTPVAVTLAASGALDGGSLDANGRIELAERSGEAATDADIAAADARHRLLALARRSPRDPQSIALARTLASERSRDPIVAVAFTRLALAGAIDVPSMPDVLSRLDPSDPLVAAAAFDCAVRSGDLRTIPLARARLAAVAHTAAERERVRIVE